MIMDYRPHRVDLRPAHVRNLSSANLAHKRGGRIFWSVGPSIFPERKPSTCPRRGCGICKAERMQSIRAFGITNHVAYPCEHGIRPLSQNHLMPRLGLFFLHHPNAAMAHRSSTGSALYTTAYGPHKDSRGESTLRISASVMTKFSPASCFMVKPALSKMPTSIKRQ